MACYAQCAEADRETIHCSQKHLYGDHAMDHALQRLLRDDRMFLDQFGEIVEPTCDCKGEEDEAKGEAQVSLR